METTIPASPERVQPTEVMALEMELEDHSELDYDTDEDLLLPATATSTASSGGTMVELAQNLVTYMKLWIQLYPRASLGIGTVLSIWVLVTFIPLAISHRPQPPLQRNHLERDYTKLATDYDLRKANIHHWCLFGGNDKCYCEDPTQGASREEAPGWSESHTRNKQHISDALERTNDRMDVVFVGSEVFQAWGEGQFLGRKFDEGAQIAGYFNQTFQSSNDVQGLALGIYTDRSTNLLWRLGHGEMPTNLNPKVWWILIGADDLALGMCSEDVVILGILRVAEEIAFHHPNAKIVIQGLLPRSNHKDGSLHITDETKGSSFRHNSKEEPFEKTNIWSFRTDQMDRKNLDPGHSTTSSALQQAAQQSHQPYFNYYIWPSILEINKELRGFCNQDEYDQFEYVEFDDLFVEQVGAESRIKKDLMPNSILLSLEGHKVLMDAVKGKLKELLKDGFD